MKKRQVIKVLGAFIIVAAVAGTTAFAGGSTIKVETQVVGQGGIVQTVEAEGHIETETEKTYYANVSAPIAAFSLETGDVVKEGDLLVSYDTEDFDRSVEQARLQAEALQAGYNGSVAQSRELKQAYQDAVSQDTMYREAYEAALKNVNDLQYNIEVVADAVEDQSEKINIKIAQLDAEIAQKNALAASSDDADDIEGYMEEAAWMQVEQAKLKKKLLELEDTGAKPIENRYFEEAQMYLNEIATQRSVLQQEMLSTEHAAMNASQLNQLAQNVELANITLQWNEEEAAKAKEGVIADLTGVVSEISVEEGAYVAEGTRLFTLKDMEHVKAVVEVTSHEMGQIAVGQKAVVEVAGNFYTGSVSKICMEAVTDSQNKAKLQIEIHIDEPDNGIYLGTDVDVTIETGSNEQAVLLPNEALYTDDNGDYCYLVEEGVIAKRYLTCGLSASDSTEILEGLNGGEHVIIDAMTDDKVGKSAQER